MIKKEPSRHQVEIVTLHPSSIFGPTFIDECSGSIEGIVKIIRRDIPGIPEMWLPCIDVRDCAKAHINALLAEPGKLHGHRILLNSDSF